MEEPAEQEESGLSDSEVDDEAYHYQVESV